MAKGTTSTPQGHVNLKMLAEHLQLSQTTVSLVLNNSPSAKSIPASVRDRTTDRRREPRNGGGGGSGDSVPSYGAQIGRASWRERVWISVVAVSLKKTFNL